MALGPVNREEFNKLLQRMRVLERTVLTPATTLSSVKAGLATKTALTTEATARSSADAAKLNSADFGGAFANELGPQGVATAANFSALMADNGALTPGNFDGAIDLGAKVQAAGVHTTVDWGDIPGGGFSGTSDYPVEH